MSRKGKFSLIILLILIAITFVYMFQPKTPNQTWTWDILNTIKLPEPKIIGNMSVEQAIHDRRSIRSYNSIPLKLEDVSQLMWAAQGITNKNNNYRTSPSGSHVFPLEVYILIGENCVNGLEKGLYHYDPFSHSLNQITKEDSRLKLSKASGSQPWVEKAPVNIIITGNYQKIMDKYPDDELCARFINDEAGHAGQNIYLESTARKLGTVAIGSFDNKQIHDILPIPSTEKIAYIYPVGNI